MRVTFTKTDAARYSVTVTSVRGQAPAPHQGSGYDAYLPHDLAQFLVEEQFGVRLGVYGQLAVGDANAAAGDRSGRSRRTAHRVAEATRSDITRSERLVALCLPLWQARAGRAPATPPVIDMTLATPFDVDHVMHRFDEVSAQWAALATGESITLDWPAELAVRPARQRVPNDVSVRAQPTAMA
jgi:hypothetical protein